MSTAPRPNRYPSTTSAANGSTCQSAAGDPFVAGNARRLQAIAWWVLAGEVLRLAIGATAWAASSPAQGLDLDTGFSLAPWLAVLLLFVLARVFAEGTRLRDDLEGTV